MVNAINFVRNAGQRIYGRSTVAVFVLLLASASIFAQSNDGMGIFKFEKQEGTRTAQLVFEVHQFSLGNHKSITVVKENTMIDGRLAYGTDISIPSREIVSLKLYIDGKSVEIPKRLYADCFNPNLDSDSFSLKFGVDNQSLIATMHGSDGAGSYDVTWTFRKNGQHSRSIKKSEH